jgi:hypothetical protein
MSKIEFCSKFAYFQKNKIGIFCRQIFHLQATNNSKSSRPKNPAAAGVHGASPSPWTARCEG